VAVEKLAIQENQAKFGDRKCLSEPDKSFVGHPEAIRFLRILARRVFQQPLADALIEELGLVTACAE
jgi:hypothetical protein